MAEFENDAEPHGHDVIDPRWAKLAALKTVEEDPAAGGDRE